MKISVQYLVCSDLTTRQSAQWGHVYPRPVLPAPLCKVYSFDSGDGSYINTTLKEFSHTLCKAHDLDIKGRAWEQGSCLIKL